MEARLNITINGQNGDLPDMVDFDASDTNIRQFATEAVRNGDIPGITADPNADFENFVVDRFNANEARPFPLLVLRPKTPFGI